MTPELLTCPFCAEHPSYRAYDFQGNLFISVSCAGCDIAFDNADCGETKPYKLWNRRAPDARTAALVAAGRQRLAAVSEAEIDAADDALRAALQPFERAAGEGEKTR